MRGVFVTHHQLPLTVVLLTLDYAFSRLEVENYVVSDTADRSEHLDIDPNATRFQRER